MPTLPANANLDFLRHQAKDLLHAARRGEADALRRVQAVSSRLTLSSAQLAIAREYGFPSWTKLRDEVDARRLDLAGKVNEFCAAVVSVRPDRAARMLAESPAIASYNFATAVLTGDVDRVEAELRRDRSLATRRVPPTGWTALHAVCASRLHQLDPARADRLATVARMLIDAGADPLQASPRWTPLGCAIAGTNSGRSNRPVVELLLAHGARPGDEDLYLAGFAHDRRELLRLLIDYIRDPAELGHAFAVLIFNDDVGSVRLLLDAGADPRRYRDDDGKPVPAVWAATSRGCSVELVELLLDYGADPYLTGPDGRTAYRVATSAGRTDLLALLRRHGAKADATDGELFLSACMRGDREEAERRLEEDSAVIEHLDAGAQAALVRAAERGNTGAVALMLDLGMPPLARGDDGATALHAAAYSGNADTVRLLLDRGADIEVRDTTWNSTPLEWAAVGSGERPISAVEPDWPTTVSLLLAHGASTEGITLTADDLKPPSLVVASLLRRHISEQGG
jgi:ankyrin repeat protein